MDKKSAFLIAISKSVNSANVLNSKKILNDWGFKVKYSKNITSKYLGYAGKPNERAEQINKAYSEKNVDVIFSLMGGMGAVHVADKINYDSIKKTNKVLVGYSDITLLLNYINRKTGKRCIHGPNLGKTIEEYNKKTISCLFDVLDGKNYNVKINKKDIYKGGIAKAPIVGGNIRLLVRSLGTKYEIETNGKIVFLEAIDKNEQWIFDMLWQMKLAGKFDNVEGIMLGYFTNCGKEIEKYLKEFFKDFQIPIVMNQPFGHEEPNLSIPIGEKCIIDTERGCWRIIF
jgi:muramoyltetrapeptide carboxypeptidase